MNLTNKVKDRILAFIVLSLGFAGYYATRSFPGQSGVFPRGIFVFAMASAALLFFGTFFGLSLKEKSEKYNYKRVLIIALSTLIYFQMINFLGYFIATPLFLFTVSYLLELRKFKLLVLYPLGFTFFLYVSFVILLHVPLPMGIFE
ncbi:MAG: tripartite tricarboxylate transporter TctB family protein [Atribacterota bacterium]|nr:tripartite tricarboxylate transporter TctB family protein [Atribacterota bacterium]